MVSNLVLFNGNIYTMNPRQPHATALAIRAGRISYVGDDGAAARAAGGGGAEVIDLAGGTVLPGLSDAHIHFGWYSLDLSGTDLDGVPSLEQALVMVGARAAATPVGEWVSGRGWNHHLWGGRLPTCQQLDAVAPHHPVLLTRKDGHSVWANSAALAAAGVSAATANPAGGLIIRDEHGEPTGVLQENPAMRLLYQAKPTPSVAQIVAAMMQGMQQAHQHGLTSIHTILPDVGGEAELAALRQLREQGRLKLRVSYMIRPEQLGAALAAGEQSGVGDDWLRFGHLKLFSDGSLGSLTADLLEPLASSDSRGVEVTAQDELVELTQRAAAGGVAVAIHAIGDRAVRRTLDALAQARKLEGAARLRHRVEHAQLVDPADFARFAALGVIASVQPIHAPSDWQVAEQHWGAARARRSAYVFRTLLDYGTRLAFGSDCPVETLDPILGIHAAVTRQRTDDTPRGGWNSEQCLSVAEAVAGYTRGTAYAAGAEATQGSLEVGKLGDCVVLNADIFAIPPQEIKHARVVYTVVGGEVVIGDQ